ncbi:MAG: purine-binding chemotaxis protein CheW, partial [Oscillospiraceae bacterium]|nr:purine-binding chemotaxis protein CheW [Oscillospiraceae bacterium]
MHNILTDTVGSDQLELLEFTVGSGNYGINIAKVNEIMTNEPVTPMPNAHKAIEGIFIPRDRLITVVDLHTVLGAEPPASDKSIFIVCSFNDVSVAFHVTAVKGFSRILWDDI